MKQNKRLEGDTFREPESYFHPIMKQVPGITYIAKADKSRTILYISPQVETILGYSVEKCMSEPYIWHRQVHHEDRRRVTKTFTQPRAGTERIISEYRIFTRDGRILRFHDQALLIPDNTGSSMYLQGIMLDITGYKPKDEKSSKTIVECRRYKKGTASLLKSIGCILNYPAFREVAKTIFLFCKKLVGATSGYIALLSEDGEKNEVIYLKYKNHLEELVKVRTVELTKANTHLQSEITKRLRMEKELEAERNKLRSILNAMDDGVCLVSDNYDVEYVNPVLEREFGLANGRKCYEYFHDKREICEWCKNKEVFAGKSVRWEWHSFKTNKAYDLYDTSVVNSDGSLSKLEFLHDVTERKKTEEILKNYQKELRSLAAELSIVEERERRSVAVDIHDNIGQSLAAAKIKLGLIRQSLPSTDAAVIIDQIGTFIDEAINYTHSLIINLSLPILNDVDFSEAVEWLCDQFREQYGIPINFDKDGEINPIKDETRVILFKCVRELLNNIVKHSNAQKVKVSVSKYDTDIIITVEDDGIGFDINQLNKRFGGNGGFGLFSIRERLHHLSGQMTIQSNRNGTLIAIKAPLQYTPERL